MITDDQKWVPIGQAAVMLGVSERTVRNYIHSGKVPVHKDRGRTYVDVSPILSDRPSDFQNQAAGSDSQFETVGEGNPGTLLKIIGAELALRGQAQEMVTRIERETDALRADVLGARRSGRLGWTLVGILLIGMGAGAAWSVYELQRRDGRVDTAEAVAASQAGALQSAQDQARSAQDQYEKTFKDYDAQLVQLQDQLSQTRKALDARVAAEIERAGEEAARREEAARVELSALAHIKVLDGQLEGAQKQLARQSEAVQKIEQSLDNERVKVALQSERRVEDAGKVAEARTKIESLERMLTEATERLARWEKMFRTDNATRDEANSSGEPAGEAAAPAPGGPVNAAPASDVDQPQEQAGGKIPADDATAQATPG